MAATWVACVVAGCGGGDGGGGGNPAADSGPTGNMDVGGDESQPDAGSPDVPVVSDTPTQDDTQPQTDVQPTDGATDGATDDATDGATDGGTDGATDGATDGGDAATTCATNADCAHASGGPVCDTATGACVPCTATMNMCPTGNYCSADTCVPGCATDADCSGGSAHCNTTTHMCTGCRPGMDADCAAGTICNTAGTCVPGCSATHPCGIGSTCCGAACVNTQSDGMNCGACGMACGTGTTCCAGACATTTTDATNCGACGTACTLAHVATQTCTAGACAIGTGACAAGYGDCDMMTANGCETAVGADAMNCGACGHACPTGTNATASCTAGVCALTCAGGFGDCDHVATNGCEATLATNVANCGACGHGCAALPNATPSCTMGTCGSACNAGFGDCDGNPANGCETNLNTTGTACGSCTTVCSVPNATASCTAGACGVGTCNPGFADCDGLVTNGCETNATTSSNCGACGRVCGAGTACSASGGTYTCMSVCSGMATACGGACVNTATDPTNCGGCAVRCVTPPNAVPGCTAGTCGLASCIPGFGDCNHAAGDGCEVDLRSTLTNCGTCGTVCGALANATPACTGGACAIGSCNPNFGDCDAVATNGCESDLRVTVANCGACGHACTAPANATAGCAAGACGIGTCTAGFADCNHAAADGCETNTATDNRNCGTCGTTCAAGTACSAGACTSVCTAGTTFCAVSGTCANLTNDTRNCGACGHVCAAGQTCRASACIATPPANDTCAGAIPISLATHGVDIVATTVNAFHDLATPTGCPAVGGPASAGADVFYSFTLAVPELVYADTVGTTYDSILFFANSCTTALPLSASSTGLVECNDDLNDIGCTRSTQSQVVAYLQPGTYYLVLSSYGGSSGTATIHFRHEPVGNNGAAAGAAPPAPRLLPAGTSSQAGTTAGVGLINSDSEGLTACYTNGGGAAGTHGNSAEQTYFWRTCPEAAAGAFTATTCGTGTTFDTLIYVATPSTAASAGDCDDDNSACTVAGTGGTGGLTSILPHPTGAAVTIPAGANLHTFVVDGYAAGEVGNYTVQVTRP